MISARDEDGSGSNKRFHSKCILVCDVSGLLVRCPVDFERESRLQTEN
ncbi:hypothetical protein CEXT_335081, partial [Caerostris extrusa]